MIYYIIINITAFIDYGRDKKKAQHDEWRISENHLLNLSIFGGALGALAGMKYFHHKTRKPRFWVINIIMMILHLCILISLSQIHPQNLTH